MKRAKNARLRPPAHRKNTQATPYTISHLRLAGSFGHNGAFGTIFCIDPDEGLIRIFLEQVFGSGNESNIFMAMAAVIAE